jgi:hypothetical protein
MFKCHKLKSHSSRNPLVEKHDVNASDYAYINLNGSDEILQGDDDATILIRKRLLAHKI